MRYILDSNILMDYPSIVEAKTDELIISVGVLKELDDLKKHNNPDIAQAARKAAVYIARNLDNISWDTEEREGPVDQQLLEITDELRGTLLTNDIYLKVQATIKGISNKGYSQKDDYTGVYYWWPIMDDTLYNLELDNLLKDGTKPECAHLCENQYMIVQNNATPKQNKHGETIFETIAIFKCKDDKYIEVEPTTIKNNCINTIRPLNPEQTCLFDALNDRRNTIVYAGGQYGTGKSFILNNFALQELESGKIKKIVYIPNNAFAANTMEIGALPGELLDKIEGQIGPLIDLVGIDQVHRMMQDEQLEIIPMGSIRGRSFSDSIVIVNEAQNLTEDHVKLLIARCGEGTRIMFDGDIKQTDAYIFKNKNGLKLLLNLRKSSIYSKHFATIKLKTTERSLTANAAAYLDTFGGDIIN